MKYTILLFIGLCGGYTFKVWLIKEKEKETISVAPRVAPVIDTAFDNWIVRRKHDLDEQNKLFKHKVELSDQYLVIAKKWYAKQMRYLSLCQRTHEVEYCFKSYRYGDSVQYWCEKARVVLR